MTPVDPTLIQELKKGAGLLAHAASQFSAAAFPDDTASSDAAGMLGWLQSLTEVLDSVPVTDPGGRTDIVYVNGVRYNCVPDLHETYEEPDDDVVFINVDAGEDRVFIEGEWFYRGSV